LKNHEICVPLLLVSIAPNEQDTSLTLIVLGEFKTTIYYLQCNFCYFCNNVKGEALTFVMMFWRRIDVSKIISRTNYKIILISSYGA
jgi:hypothetical protein